MANETGWCGVIENVIDFDWSEPRIDRNCNDPEPGGGVDKLDVFRAVREQ
jgi:hypothetical protein